MVNESNYFGRSEIIGREIMNNQFTKTLLTIFLVVGLLPTLSLAQRLMPDRAKIEAEAKQIQELVEAREINGLIQMLSTGEFPSKVTAAEYLAEIGDERALAELENLNKSYGGWVLQEIHEDRSGVFAVAICRILNRNLSEKDQIEALFELLEGRGPAVPESFKDKIVKVSTVNGVVMENVRTLYNNLNFNVGKRVAIELDKFDDPLIVPRLRQIENRGVSPHAVWMEVRDMDMESAIARCQQIARDEGGEQRYGAIHCLKNFGIDAIEALNQLALEGHGEAITVLGDYKEDEKVFELLCWHLTNNTNYFVRRNAISPVAFVKSDSFRLKSLQTLVKALYDPSERIRKRAASSLSSRAYRNKKFAFDQMEDSLLIALKHPDEEVRQYIRESLERLGCERLDEKVPEPPPFRTDLEERSKPPLTAAQRLKAKTEPLEKEAVKAMEKGPAEKAVMLYTELLELRPDYEPYQVAFETAQAYVNAAEQTSEQWYSDAPYIGIKGRYSYYLADIPEDTSMLKEKFELTQYLDTTNFPEWSSIFSEDPKGKDQFKKALKLHEHIAKYYAANEYLVILSKAQIAGMKSIFDRDLRAYALSYIDIYSIPVEDIIDSTNERRNAPIAEKDGKTQAQLDFERYYYNEMTRERVIELCSRNGGNPELFDEIIERCILTDPKLVEMAKDAKAKIAQK